MNSKWHELNAIVFILDHEDFSQESTPEKNFGWRDLGWRGKQNPIEPPDPNHTKYETLLRMSSKELRALELKNQLRLCHYAQEQVRLSRILVCVGVGGLLVGSCSLGVAYMVYNKSNKD